MVDDGPRHHHTGREARFTGPKSQVGIFEICREVRLVEPAQGIERVATHHPARPRRIVDVTVEPPPLPGVGEQPWSADGFGATVGEDHLTRLLQAAVRVQQRRRRNAHRRVVEGGDQRFQPALRDFEVGVHQRDHLTAGDRHPGVAAPTETEVAARFHNLQTGGMGSQPRPT